MSNEVTKGEARINQNHASDFECERFRLTRGAAQAEQSRIFGRVMTHEVWQTRNVEQNVEFCDQPNNSERVSNRVA